MDEGSMFEVVITEIYASHSRTDGREYGSDAAVALNLPLIPLKALSADFS
jgi:hypothetical protein